MNKDDIVILYSSEKETDEISVMIKTHFFLNKKKRGSKF